MVQVVKLARTIRCESRGDSNAIHIGDSRSNLIPRGDSNPAQDRDHRRSQHEAQEEAIASSSIFRLTMVLPVVLQARTRK